MVGGVRANLTRATRLRSIRAMRLTQGLFRFPLAGLLCLSTAAFAESQLSVRVTPPMPP